jgi:hypothetical protein
METQLQAGDEFNFLTAQGQGLCCNYPGIPNKQNVLSCPDFILHVNI